VIIERIPDLPPVARGKEAVRHMLSAWVDAFEEFAGEIEEYIDVDDRHVGCLVHYRGRMRESALEVDYRGVDIWEFRERKMVRGTLGYSNRQSALEALREPE
jgi:ketosteroid isomerase-like protein